MPINIPEKFQPQVQHALDKAVNDARLFPDPVHQAYEPEGINAPWFRNIYDRDFPLPGKLGDWIPPMAAAEGMTKAGESLGMGDYGKAGLEGGFAMLDAIDPSPIAWGAMGSGLGTMIGVNAKNFPLDQLDIARDIEKAGGGRDEIFQQTKLWRGADKKWRKEIDDSNAELKLFSKRHGYANAGAPNYQQSPTAMSQADYIHHPELKQSYDDPSRVKFKDLRRNQFGQWSPATDEITMATNSLHNRKVDEFLHENQHSIQGREGFAFGGNVESSIGQASKHFRDKWIETEAFDTINKFDSLAVPVSQYRKASNILDFRNIKRNRDLFNTTDYLQYSDAIRRDIGSPPKSGKGRLNWAQDAGNWIANKLEHGIDIGTAEILSDANRMDIKKQIRSYEGKLGRLDRGKLRDAQKLSDEMDAIDPRLNANFTEDQKYQLYRRLAGEVEARNVQTRADWPQWKRDMIPPWMTEDVPQIDQIVRFK